jgi:hypothetical protein
MGFARKDDLILNFDKNTVDYSTTIPYMDKINADAKALVNKLPSNSLPRGMFYESDNYAMYKKFEKNTLTEEQDNNFSETSPFISSDVYKNLLSKQQRGGGEDEEEEEESTTSTSESLTEKTEKHKKHSTSSHKKEHKSRVSSNNHSDSTVSYLSSSAHTDGVNSDSATKSSATSHSGRKSSNKNSSEILSTISFNHKGGKQYTESVNTSDINIISVDE